MLTGLVLAAVIGRVVYGERTERQVWVAMEFVVGRTLNAWREADRPTWKQVLEVIKQAYQDAYQQQNGTVIINVEGDSVQYDF